MSKSKDVKIGKVEIEIAGEKLKLNLLQAKELRDILNETFPAQAERKRIIHEYWDYGRYYPRPSPYNPFVTWSLPCSSSTSYKSDSNSTLYLKST